MAPTRTPLPGDRWHFVHGPIDLVIGAEGDVAAVVAAHESAWARFQTVLPELVTELPLLRQPVRDGANPVQGAVARRMWQACAAVANVTGQFITPMAAVAGAVAEALVAAYAVDGIARAYVNNGGDIALHLQPQAEWCVGLVADIARTRTAPAPALDGHFAVRGTDAVRGIATSGWRGRSQSLGIADAVTVLAASAPLADAAATLIANAVNVDDAHIQRAPACTLRDDSDLGERLVTIDVPALSAPQVDRALEAGAVMARRLQAAGLVHAAVLVCQKRQAVLQPLPTALPEAA